MQRQLLSQPGIGNVRDVVRPFAKIVKEEPLSDMSDNYLKTSWQSSNVGKKMSTDVSEFYHREGINASAHRPRAVSGPGKRDSSRESVLERNADSPPQAIITPLQAPPRPMPSTSGKRTSSVLNIFTPPVMKKYANQDYPRVHQAMVDSEFIYCSTEENSENNMAIPNTVSGVTEAPSNNLQTQSDTVLQRDKSQGLGSFLNSSVAADTPVNNSESKGNKSTIGENYSIASPVKLSSKNKKNYPKEISGLEHSFNLHADHATDLSSTSEDNVIGLTKTPDNPLQLVHNNNFLEKIKLRDQQLTFSSSVEADKTHEQSCVMPDNSQEEITSLEHVGTSSKSSAVECLVVFYTNPSTVDKPNKYVSQMEKNTEDLLQQVRLNEGKRSFRDNGEISHTEYVTESANFEPTNKNFDCSLPENSSSELSGFVEYVHVTDYSGDLEISLPRRIKGANDGLNEPEVKPHASDFTKEKWSTEASNAKTYNNEGSNHVHRIFLSTDEVTGRVINPEVIPECCPVCYTAICPSRITVNSETFDMMTVCIGCKLTISIAWWTKSDADVNKKRPGHKRPWPKTS